MFCRRTGSRESRVEKLAGSNHHMPVAVKSLSTSSSQMTSLRLSSLDPSSEIHFRKLGSPTSQPVPTTLSWVSDI